jgi:hypothetical protein
LKMSDDTPPRRLISIISTEGKSPEQLKAEALQAIQKWQDAQRPREGD